MNKEKEHITLGSGKVYYSEFDGSLPANDSIETEEQLAGYISGGASITYEPSFTTVTDDLGIVQKTILTEESSTFKTGIMTWCGNTLAILCSTARVTEDKKKKIRTVKIGGVGNYDGKKYLWRFVNSDKESGKVTRLTVVGKNEAGFTLTYAKDTATTIDAEITAESIDEEGTKIIYEETMLEVDTTSDDQTVSSGE